MKYLFAILLVTVSSWTDLDKIAKVNKLKKEAKTAYNNGDYQKALDNYLYLVDSMQVEDDNIVLNMANAYYKLNDTTNAVNNYQAVVDSKDNVVRSVAQQQLGVIANRSKKFKEALEHFKEAIKADPANEEARYNYELLKKVLEEQEQQNKDQQNKDNKDQQKRDQQKKDQQKQDQQKGDQEKKDQEQQKDEQKEGEGDEKEEQQKDDKKDGEKKEDGKPKEEQQQKP
ncbi:tetratricopeptide repeat protein, partial [Fulvivirga kasyanovii]